MKIRKNDTVSVLTGKYKGIKSTVQRVIKKEGKVVVKDVNIGVRHLKKQGDQGGRIKFERPVSVSNVALVCPKCEKTTRIGYKIEGTKKLRVCKKCGEII